MLSSLQPNFLYTDLSINPFHLNLSDITFPFLSFLFFGRGFCLDGSIHSNHQHQGIV